VKRVTDFDVAVVGGGPAGSTCAKELGERGVSTALFDHSHPREKPCGGGVTNKVVRQFEIPESIADVITEHIFIESPHGTSLKISSPRGGFLVMRKKFDFFLLERAKKHCTFFNERVNAIKWEGNEWILETGKRKVSAKIVVGADGVNSLVRRTVLAPIPNQLLAQCVGYHIPHDSEYIKKNFSPGIYLFFYSHKKEGGYFWIFPKQNFVTVGTGLRFGVKGIKELVDAFISSHPAAKKIIKPKQEHIHSHLIPFVNKPSFYDLPTSGENWVLVGDAAGHVNPLTGEGIAYAMMGGRLAAEAISKNDLPSYEKKWRKEFGPDLYIGARLQNIFYNPTLMHIAIKLGIRSKTLQNFFKDLIEANITYNKLFKHAIVTFPKVLIEQIL